MPIAVPDALVVGDPITAAWLTQLRGWAAAAGVWSTNYVPTLTANGNPNIGNGAAYGEFCQINDLVIDCAILRFGTSGASGGSGTYLLSLPVAPAGGLGSAGVDGATLIGSGIVVVNNLWTPVQCELFPTGVVCHLRYLSAPVNGSVVDVDSTHPGSWGTGDTLRVYRTYQAA